jgi:lipoprotein releasing system ATP-binding protein
MKSKTNNPFLSVKNISKSYYNNGAEVVVFRDISFSVTEGEVIAIMGPSGAGKSTLLNLIGTLDYPDSGEILFGNQNPFTLLDNELAKFRNEKVGFVFQFHHLLPEFTALENTMIPTLIYQSDMEKAKAIAKEMLEKVGLTERINHRPSALSGGERQRVAVARALINNPLVVLADEPTGNLDIHNGELLLNLIMELNEKYNRTFIIATHNPTIAERCHRVLYLEEGNLKIE